MSEKPTREDVEGALKVLYDGAFFYNSDNAMEIVAEAARRYLASLEENARLREKLDVAHEGGSIGPLIDRMLTAEALVKELEENNELLRDVATKHAEVTERLRARAKNR